jgi:hypothetical protein
MMHLGIVRNVHRDGTTHEAEESFIQHEDNGGMIYFDDVITPTLGCKNARLAIAATVLPPSHTTSRI